MAGPAPVVLAAALLLLAPWLWVLAPRRLFAEANGGSAPTRHDLWLALGLALAGGAVFWSTREGGFGPALTLALACQVMAATVYADLRFLVIPDLYSGALLALGLVRAGLTGDWTVAVIGAVTLGALLAVVAWGFRLARGVDGLGFGDVKLAVALGALLGPVWGLRAVAAAAVCGALALIVVQAMRDARARKGAGGPQEPLLAPFGAVLSLTSAAALLWTSR